MNLKKALKHDVEVAGKTIPTMILVGLFLVGGSSAAILSSFGTVSGTADVDQAIQVNGNNGELELTESLGAATAGTYFVSDLDSGGDDTMNITSQTTSAVTVDLQTSYAEGDATNDLSYSASLDGVTSHNIVYETPDRSEFDVVVSTAQGLEEALTNDSSKILVEPDTYTLSGDKDLGLGASDTELISAEGPAQTTIDLDEVTIEAGAGDSFTVRGFKFTGSGNGQHGDGFLFRSTDRSDTYDGTVTVEDNIFDASTTASDQREYRYVWTQEVSDVNVEDNFFTGNSDAGVEVNAKATGSSTVTINSNTFASLVDKGVALRVADDAGTVSVENNNFVSNSNSAIQLGSVSSHVEFDADSNYFNHTGLKVEDDSSTGIEEAILNEANNPQTDGSVTVPAGETVEVTQLTYLDIAVSGTTDYALETSVNPVR